MSATHTAAAEQTTVQRTAEQLLNEALADLLAYQTNALQALLHATTRAYAVRLAALHHALVREFVPVSNVELLVAPEEVIGCITVHCAPTELADVQTLASYSATPRVASDGTTYVTLCAADEFAVELIIPPAPEPAAVDAAEDAPQIH